MYRLIDQKLNRWNTDPRRKPLIIRGARQVGKTYSVMQFGKNYYRDHYVSIDLEENPDLKRIFEKDLNAKRIIQELELVTQKRIEPTQDLIFIDEIQTCPRAIMALRYFYEEMPELHVLAAGSLLEFALGEISFPVGRVQFQTMYPLTFFEFLKATGKDLLAEELLKLPYPQGVDASDMTHQLLLDELRKYFFVGGMPEAVKVYNTTNSIQETFRVHRDITQTYSEDFSKYSKRADKILLKTVLKGIVKNIGAQIKYTHLAEDYSSPAIKRAVELLHEARVIQKIHSTSPAGQPLGAEASAKIFKAIVLDIGLMHSLCNLPLDFTEPQNKLLAIYQGALAEQFVGQELLAAKDEDLYYWSRTKAGSAAEVDFLSFKDGLIHPIEVKSGPAGRLRSLHLLLNQYPQCGDGYVFCESQYSYLKEQRLIFAPLYSVFPIFRDYKN